MCIACCEYATGKLKSFELRRIINELGDFPHRKELEEMIAEDEANETGSQEDLQEEQ